MCVTWFAGAATWAVSSEVSPLWEAVASDVRLVVCTVKGLALVDGGTRVVDGSVFATGAGGVDDLCRHDGRGRWISEGPQVWQG